MDNFGGYTLGATQVGPAGTRQYTPITDLAGMKSVSLDFDFKPGAGGTSGHVIVKTSLDGGTTWRHVAFFGFTTSAVVKQANISTGASVAVRSYVDLVADGINDGVLGDQLMVEETIVGSYVGASWALRACVR